MQKRIHCGSISPLSRLRERVGVRELGKPRVPMPVAVIAAILWTAGLAIGQTEGAGASAPPDGFLTIVFSGGWVGLAILSLLFALSLTAAYLVFDNLMSLRHTELIPDKLGDQVRQLLVAGRNEEANELCRARPSFLSFVLLHGLAEVDGGWTAVEKALEDATAEQAARLFRKIEYLSVIGNIAPMVGLLGTVTGMIFAFQQVANTQGSAGAGELAEGIYQALITTVGGLVVAIPSLGAFAVFRNRVDQLVAEAAYVAQHVFTSLKRSRTSKTARTRPKPPPVDETK
jgi:biopolymer transport protein ExbB